MMKCFQNKTLEEEVRNQTCSALCQERGEISINMCADVVDKVEVHLPQYEGGQRNQEGG